MEILDRLIRFFNEYGVEPNKENARSFIFNCPACGGDKKLYIQKSDGRTICFKQGDSNCPSSRYASKALALITGLPAPRIHSELYQSVKIEETLNISFEKEKVREQTKKIEPIKWSDLPHDYLLIVDPLAVEGYKYLLGRGITPELMQKHGVVYSPSMRRVIFPVIMNNEIYGWQSRAIDPVDKKFRMLNLPGEWKSRTLMFHDNLKDKDFAVLAEGAISALKFAQVGGFVASMGKMVSFEQLDLLLQANIKKLYLALDRDAAENMKRIKNWIDQKTFVDPVSVYRIDVPDHRGDFGDCTYEECALAFNRARLIQNELLVYFDEKNALKGRL